MSLDSHAVEDQPGFRIGGLLEIQAGTFFEFVEEVVVRRVVGYDRNRVRRQ
jgi:hypothetical protein